MLIVPNVTMEEYIFYDVRHITPLFIVLVIVLLPLRLAIDSFWPSLDPQSIPIIRSSSWLNRVFAGHCFEMSLILFIVICYLKISRVNSSANLNIDSSPSLINSQPPPLRLNSKTDKLLRKLISPSPTPNSQKEINKKLMSIQVCKILVIYTSLVILIITTFITNSSLLELVQKWTGGECTNPNFHYYRGCLVDGSKYLGGFKISGHCLITSTFSLFIIWEGIMWKGWIQSPLEVVVALITLFVLASWITLFTITCLFYHTFMERLIGTFIGTSIFSLCYIYLSL